jgi:acyl carrier protein
MSDVKTGVLEVVDGLARELGTRPPQGVSLEDSLDRDLGLGSLERVELHYRLEHAFGVHLPDETVFEAQTPRSLVEAIQSSTAQALEAVPAPLPPVGAGVAAPVTARTLVEVLRWQAERAPDRVHVFLREEDGRETPITYASLWQRATEFATSLQQRHVRPGDRVALMLRTEPAFFAAFFGVLLAGATPVPIYPPFRLDRVEEYVRRQLRILTNAGPSLLVTFRDAERLAALLARRVPSVRGVLAAEQVEAGAGQGAMPPRMAEAPALIQYTSGSTGDPKGVVLSHANLLANIRAIGDALGIGPDDVGVSWLPLYHDMGLIGVWLGSLYHGIPTVIMSPLAFLARPARWLRALHAHRGTISPAPNFAFDLCVKRIEDEEIAGMDLGSWRLALNGSEPVSPETIERFTRRFEPYGFRRRAMTPVYGLAESAVGLTVTPPERGPRVDAVSRQRFQREHRAEPAPATEAAPLRFVGCGNPLPGHEVRIVDDGGRPVDERVEGHVQFRGPSVMRGYYRNPGATRAAVRDGWVDSGDLGYIADREVFVTGRQKDIVIKAGRNLHPQEVEELVGDVHGVRKGCVAAFGVADPAIGTERLVVVAESRETTSRGIDRIRVAVREAVVTALGVPPDVVVVAPPGSVLKTPSGKVRRAATRDVYLAGRLSRRVSRQAQWARVLIADAVARARDAGATVGGLLFTGWALLVLSIATPILWLLVAIAARGAAVHRLTGRWANVVLHVSGYSLRVEGLEHVRERAPVILTPNHASYLDALVLLAAIPLDFRFVAKRELTGTPLIGTIIRKAGHPTVTRTDLGRSAGESERVTALLRGGTSLCLFPEGTFDREPGLLPFRLGAFKAAVDTGCPVVPVTVLGTREALPAGTWLPRHHPITVRIGEPILASQQTWREIVRMRDRTRAAIEDAMNAGGDLDTAG